MKSIKRSRIVVVADSDQGRILAARLRRMEVAEVTAVAGLEEARRLCQSGSADACDREQYPSFDNARASPILRAVSCSTDLCYSKTFRVLSACDELDNMVSAI